MFPPSRKSNYYEYIVDAIMNCKLASSSLDVSTECIIAVFYEHLHHQMIPPTQLRRSMGPTRQIIA